MAFGESFTGRGTATILPENKALQAQQGLNATITKAEELRYTTFKQNEAEFLKNATIDPMFVLSDAARKYQMSLIDEFNKKWGKRAQQTNYNLSTQDKQNMLTDKNFIISQAQGQVAQMEMYKQHKDLVEKNPGKFDMTKFAEATKRYMETGIYDQTMPAYQPIDFGAYVNEQAQKLGFNLERKEVPVGYGMIATEAWNIPKGEEGKFIISQLGENPQADADFWNRWNAADKEYWFEEGKKQDKNPIQLWAEQEFAGVRQSKQTGKRAIPGMKTGTTFDWNFAIGGQHNRNNEFDVLPNKKVISSYGTTIFPDFMNLGQVSFSSDPQQIEEIIEIDETGKEKRTRIGDVSRLEIVGYSPSKDILIVKALDDGDTVSSGDILFVDASQYNDLLKRRPFGLDRESLRKQRGMTQGTFVTPSATNTGKLGIGSLDNLGK
jgi:hypothetical protein